MTAPHREPEVVIVGAGPTGVTAAILLGQYGVPTLVLDRWTDVFAQPRAVHLDDEVFRILRRLGVADAFRDVSRPGAGLRLLSPSHRTLAQFDRTRPVTSNGYPQANMFDQPHLEAILRRRMAELDDVELRGGVEVTGVRTDQAGRAVVAYHHREDGTGAEVAARYVLGCDGANSIVRAAIGSRTKGLGFAPQRWLVIDVATDVDLDQWEGVHQVCGSRRAATYMRIGRDRYRWEFELLPDEKVADYDSLPKLAELLRPWARDLAGFTLIRCTEYTFRAEIADSWRRGDVFLLGDAAHLTPPFIGQGMGAGVRDAANLAWKLAAVIGGRLDAGVLSSYEDERIPHARSLVRLAVAVGSVMTRGGRAGDALRSVVAPLLPHVPVLGRQVLDSTTAALRTSALRPKAGRRGSRLPGTLCPNSELEPGRRLDDVLAGRFGLVVRSDAPVEARRAAAERGCAVVVADDVAELRDWLGRDRSALVRPDGTVAAAGRDVVRVTERLLRP